MSDPCCEGVGMTMKRDGWRLADATVECEVLARIGGCRVVRLRDGRRVIRGGDASDQGAAREWASMFCHEALPDREGAGEAWGEDRRLG